MDLNVCEIFKRKGKYLLVNVNNNKTILLSEEIYNICDKIKRGEYLNDKPEELWDKITLLKKKADWQGKRRVFTEEAREYVSRLHLIHPSINEGVLMISQQCNMACSYCYCEKNRNQAIDYNMMSNDMAELCFKYIIDNRGAFKVQNISFMGGEPLLNFPVISHLYEYWQKVKPGYKDLNLYFSLTTNGTLLTSEIAKFIKNKNIILTLSLDGPKDIHDSNRKYKNSTGTFDSVMKAIDLLKRYEIPFRVRCTVIPQADFKRIREFFNRHNFDMVVLEMVDFPRIQKEFAYQFNLSEFYEYEKKQLDMYHKAIADLRLNRVTFEAGQIRQIYKRLNSHKNYWPFSCGAGWFMMAFDSRGAIFLCHRLVGNDNYQIGNVHKGMDKKRLKELYFQFIDKSRECDHCWMFNTCKGRCMVQKSNSCDGFAAMPEDICNIYRDEALEQLLCIMDIQNMADSQKKTVNDIIYQDMRE